jgi:hypothetical protein
MCVEKNNKKDRKNRKKREEKEMKQTDGERIKKTVVRN